MSDTEKPTITNLLKELQFTIHDLLRYVFTGCIAIFVASLSISDEKWIKNAIENVGISGFAVGIVALGAVFYVMSRHTVVPFGIWLGSRRWMTNLMGNRFRTRYTIFQEQPFSMNFLDAEIAFFVCRSWSDEDGKPPWSPDIQQQLYRQHSENHLLFATSLVCMLSVIFLAWHQGIRFLLFMVFVSIFLFLVSVLADVQVFKREGALLSMVGTEKLRQILSKAGLLNSTVNQIGTAVDLVQTNAEPMIPISPSANSASL